MTGAQSGRAYIGSFTAAGGPGITTAGVDATDGSLTLLAATDALADPSYLTVAGGLLYAVSETPDGSVAAFRTDTTPVTQTGKPAPVDGDGPTHLSLWGGHVLTANYGSGSVTALPLRADGTVDASGRDVLRHTGSGPHPQRQQGPHAHQVVADPSGNWAVSVDLGTDSVRVCTLTDGRLAVHHETALRPGSGPRHLVFHPSGGHAYVLNELSPTLTVCQWDATTGILKPLAEYAVLADAPRGDAHPSAIVISSDGRFLWTATRGEDVISHFTLDASGEHPTLSSTTPCGGHWPRDLALHPSGRHLYAANERSGDITWFTLNPQTGTPTRTASIRTPAPSCVIFD
ncbi:lactonase family protein [Streptomyces kunmingensis]|uniref:Lactonase family protein n=1 Tax=Streptomyces kunmingensis TaxID=68225 RepID=A0ABU6CCQ2_9ACTN|nr:lactonase family protein [Streptomyces kunmingensis]MEB3962498.1 lactonase family protein [Streptomyces kunmingensis]